MNKDEVNKPRAGFKEKAGELTDDPELQGKGVAEQAAGHAQEGFGTAKRKVSEAVEELRDDDKT